MSQFPDETTPRADSQKGAAAPTPDAPPAPPAITEAEQQASTALAELPAERRAVIVLDSPKHEIALRDLVKQSADITIVNSPDGREQAHRMAMNLRKARTTIDNRGKEVRDDANKFSRAVIAEVNRLLAITAAEEERIFKLRDDYDAEQKRIEDDRKAKESARVQGHKDTIANMRALPLDMVSASAADLEDELAGIEELVLEGFTALEEFADDALSAAAQVKQQLSVMLGAAQAREAAEAQAKEAADKLAEMQRQLAEAQAALAAANAAAAHAEESRIKQGALSPTPVDGDMPIVDDDHAPAGWESVEPDPSGAVKWDGKPLHSDPAETLAGAITGAMDDAARGGSPELARAMDTIADLPVAGFSEAGLARVAAAVAAPGTLVQLRFEGFEDHTFGEYTHTGDDYTSNGRQEWLVRADGESMVVFGEYHAERQCWMVGVAGPIPEGWPVWMERGTYAYTPALCIEAPEGVEITCLERAA